MSTSRDTRLLVALAVFALLVVTFLASYFALFSKKQKNMPVICPDDAMMCPGGTTVSRSGPRCEFTACPSNTKPTLPGIIEDPIEVPDQGNNGGKTDDGVICTEEVKMCPDGSYVGRQGPRCEFVPCPPSDGKNFAL